MALDPMAVEALRLLLTLAGSGRVVVIGATVPTVLIDLRQGLAVDGRHTISMSSYGRGAGRRLRSSPDA